MANDDRPRGAEPHGKCLRTTRYVADAEVFPGDFVEMTNAGKVQPLASATSTPILGVALSYAAADGDDVSVADHPEQLFMVQSDDATEPAAQTAVGLNYDVVITAGNSTYKISRMELDGSSGVNTIDTPLRLIDVERRPDNDFGANADCVVRINMHRLASTAGNTGI